MPSLSPSIAPTQTPTTETAAPTFTPTASPTSKPSSTPTSPPSQAPTPLPSSAPTNAPVFVTMSSVLSLVTDVTSQQFLSDEPSREAFQKSVAAVVEDLAWQNVTVLGASFTARRRLLAGELEIDFSMVFLLRGTTSSDVSTLVSALKASVTAQLSEAFNSGAYDAALKTALGAQASELDLGTLDVTASTNALTDATITFMVSSPEPTLMPSLNPSPVPSSMPSFLPTLSPTALPTTVPTLSPTLFVNATASRHGNGRSIRKKFLDHIKHNRPGVYAYGAFILLFALCCCLGCCCLACRSAKRTCCLGDDDDSDDESDKEAVVHSGPSYEDDDEADPIEDFLQRSALKRKSGRSPERAATVEDVDAILGDFDVEMRAADEQPEEISHPEYAKPRWRLDPRDARDLEGDEDSEA